MGKFEGLLICTDLDGTLFRNDKTISKENLEAIEYFKREGGYFTFVTGRMPEFVADIANQVKPNAPVGCVNGGGLYDCILKKYLWTSVMPDNVSELIKCIDESFPEVGIQVCTFEKSYFSKDNITMQKFREITNAKNYVCHYTEIKEPIAKIIFGTEEDEEITMIENVLKSHPLAEKFDFIRSEKTLYEILPGGIGKGTAVTNLCRILNIDNNKTIAIGDYNNDISMFKAAGTGIAVSNACEEALSEADYITVSNEEHAIAQVIYDLENNKYK
ncbi:MAG: HAD family phosphatase [Clostridia bacterium]|nr:HAD family phosphatase [Clostridia bacterium]